MPLGASRLSLLALAQVEAGPAERPWAVQAYGDAQVDTAYSKFGGASVYLDGTGDYIEVENDFLFGSVDDFTIEFWYKKHTTNTTEQIASNRGAYNTGHWYIQFDHTTDKIQWGVNGASAQRSTSTFDDTNWHHLAIVRDSGTFELFIDGSSEGTLTGSYDWGRENEYYKFGQVATSHGNLSIDEIRVSNTARYTSGFTPNGIEFANDDSTLLLVHCNGSDGSTIFTDDNVTPTPRTAVTLTAYGNAQIDTAQSKFGGASALFDGSGDYLVPDDTTLGNAISSDYTFECWARSADPTTGAQIIYSCRNSTFGLFGWQLAFRGDLSNDPIQLFYASGNVSISYNNPSANTWYHIAVVNNAGTITLYVNGVSAGSTSVGTYNASVDGSKIGAQNNPTSTANLNGHIDELRISDTARYTASFTVPTQPFVNDYATLVLAHMNGTDGSTVFSDDVNTSRSAVGISAVGDAQVDTARSKFGGASGLCDGTGDHFAASTIQTTPIGTGDFTVEFWYYSTTTGTKYICDMKDANGQEGFQTRWSLTSNTIIFRSINSGLTSNIFTTSASLSNNAWNHLAIVRNSGTVTIYHNGTSIGSGSFTKDMSASDVLYVGGIPGFTGINGNIDEVRVSDTARYTTTFTPESTAFTNDANTLVLVHMDGADGDTDFTDDNS